MCAGHTVAGYNNAMASSGKWIDGIGPETSVAEAARRSLETRLAVVAHALPLAAHLANHDVEHVHRLRVSTRRATAALQLYRDWLPNKTRRWFKKQLRRIRRVAGEARDLDVLIERLRREPRTNVEPMLRFFAQRRSAVQPDIVELADDIRRDDRFIRKAARLFRKIPELDDFDKSAPADRLADWAPDQLAKFRAAFVELLPRGSEDIATLHQFRITAKALRYAIELLAPAFDGQLRKKEYPKVEALQERLGKITDHIAAIRLFAEWEEHNSKHTPQMGVSYLEAEKIRELEDVREFKGWWNAEGSEAFETIASEQLRND